MHSPKAPAPDPAIAAAQASEQRRAEAGQVAQTQAGLTSDTVALRRRFGTMAASVGGSAGGFTGVTPSVSFAQAVANSASGGGLLGIGGLGGGNGNLNQLIQLQ